METSPDIHVDIPLLRGGQEYYTRRKVSPKTLGGFEITYSQAPPVIINHSMREAQTRGFDQFSKLPIEDIINIFIDASEIFIKDWSSGSGFDISFEETQKLITSTTGMPIHAVENSFYLFKNAMENLRPILKILSPDHSLGVYDTSFASRGDFRYGWVRRGKNLAVVAPSNHPGVNTVWVIMSAMKFPTLLRPSEKEGIFGYRFIRALQKAGLPPFTTYYLPMARELSHQFLTQADLGIIFGSEDTTHRYQGMEFIKTYGPGRSKLIVDEAYIKENGLSDICAFLEGSVLFDGGRSCINASSLLVIGENSETISEDIANTLAQNFAKVAPMNVFSKEAELGAFVDRNLAYRINAFIDNNLAADIDVVETERANRRLQVVDGMQFLLPTVILCASKQNSRLFGVELPFPFLTILPVETQSESYKYIDRSLVISLFSDSSDYAKRLLELPYVEKLYIGELTCGINPAEPHEGFATDFLFRSKAFRPKPGIDKSSFTKFYSNLLSEIIDKEIYQGVIIPSKEPSKLTSKFRKVVKQEN